MLTMTVPSLLVTLLTSTHLINALPSGDLNLAKRQQQSTTTIAACNSTSIKPYDTSVYAKESYICSTASGVQINITYSEKTLDDPLPQSDVLSAITAATTSFSSSNSVTSDIEGTVNDTHLIIQPFSCNGLGGWNNKTPTVEQVNDTLRGLKDLATTSLKGKSLASAVGTVTAGGDNIAALTIQRKSLAYVPVNAQCT